MRKTFNFDKNNNGQISGVVTKTVDFNRCKSFWTACALVPTIQFCELIPTGKANIINNH